MSDTSITTTQAPDPTAIPTAPAVPELEQPKPTETVEFWKQKAREQEARSKANAEAAQELQAIKESQKTDAQKQVDATAQAVREAAQAKAEALAYRAAAKHGITEDFFDLLGTGDEATISARAERVGGLLKVHTENAQLRAEIDALRTGKPAPVTSRPIADLKPGATPDALQTEEDAAYLALFGPN